MRRLLFAVIGLAVVFNLGVSMAQAEEGPQMPAKVRKFLDGLTGTWKTGGTFKGTAVIQWDAQNKALIGNGQWERDGVFNSWTDMWCWDGQTEDGINNVWFSARDHVIARGEVRGKVQSAGLMIGKETVFGLDDVSSATLRVEHQSPDQFTLCATHVLKNDEKRPDITIVFTRAKQTLENEVELVNMAGKWSKAEMQVWKTVKAYWTVLKIDELMAYVHPEYMGWSPDQSMPTNQAATRLWLTNLINTRTFEITTIKPTGLKIHGNVAIANYYYTQLYRDEDGKQQTEKGRFTDILMKEKGQWLLVADHGGTTPTNDR